MSKRDWKLYVEDVLECVRKVEKYTDGMDFASFKEDDKTIDAVVKNLIVIGEAAKNISDDVKGRYEDTPWRKIVGLRNRIVHGYFSVDLEIVWSIVKRELPALEMQLQRILEESP